MGSGGAGGGDTGLDPGDVRRARVAVYLLFLLAGGRDRHVDGPDPGHQAGPRARRGRAEPRAAGAGG
ncbi:hypothetical protein ACFSTC_25010 [Nonomuraea ferruginea]